MKDHIPKRQNRSLLPGRQPSMAVAFFMNNIVGPELTLSSLFKMQWYNLTNLGPLICPIEHLYKYSAVIKD